ncbi:hypothetical protein [Mycobacterium sp. AT1]|uniref:hypothetical protein n=1 Tax=Mycobacterium sp. AT1 TaxID=1961706 RepID=UPI0009ABBCC4|nr:hypothetical protein [Mycobacterium sp. AT1]OPX12482.1 hypothetical protein B1790_03260 [Mycobacterium sp. AT1]
MNDLELIATVASASVRAALAAGGGPKTPTPLNTPAPKPPRREPVPVDHDRLAVAVHESGHLIASVVAGAEVITAIVGDLPGGFKGLTTYFSDTIPAHREMEISYAGPWSEARFRAGRRPTQRDLFDVFAGNGCRDAATLGLAGGTHLGADVVPLLDRCWPAVLAVAKKLYSDGEATQADACSALGITDGGGYTSVQLASLRSGGRTVPAFGTRTPTPA